MRLTLHTVRAKISLMAVLAALLPLAVVLVATRAQMNGVSRSVREEIRRESWGTLASIAEDIRNTCACQNEAAQQSLKTSLNLARETVAAMGRPALADGSVRWTVSSPGGQASSPVELPRITVGGTWLGQNADPRTATPLVDQVRDRCGAVCTVLQRMNRAGDMLRVATNLTGKDETRAIGTCIMAARADGTPDPVIAAALRGEGSTGMVQVAKDVYLAAYEPMRDASGEVIGMIETGVKQEGVPTLRRSIMERKVGQTGYVFVLRGSGEARGRYVISKGGARDGENILEAKDANGQFFIKDMTARAVALDSGSSFFSEYPWKNQGESRAREKVAAVAYYAPWDWVIGVSAYVDELETSTRKADAALNGLVRMSVITAIVALIVILVLSTWLSRRLFARPIERLAESAGRLALGDVDVNIDVSSRDEIGRLSEAMQDMVQNIKEQAEVASMVAAGDLSVTPQPKSDADVMARSTATMVETLRQLVAQMGELNRAALEGRLQVRGQADRFQGAYREIVLGVNATLDSVVGPLNTVAAFLDRLSRGDIPPVITEEQAGDFDRLKTSLNTCIGAVNALVRDTQSLVEAAVAGRLEQRAKPEAHQGDFRRIIQGINETLDAIVRPIHEAAGTLQQVAERDLSARMRGEYQGDFVRIKDSLNRAADNLDQGMQQVAGAVEQVAAAAAQIGSGSQTLAQGASEQASSLEEVGSSLQEISSQTRDNARHAKEAQGLAEASRQGAKKGLESMQRLSEAMEKIKASSDSTAKIVRTIDEIAFQTNLLALNAAVEAARAGDAGKGFAVVAEEVRNLAMRSAEAAKNTADLIEGSVQNAEAGVQLNAAVLAQLGEINQQANQVGEVMTRIAAASEHQSAGIGQVTSAVEQMNHLVQSQAAGSEESASAAEELAGQSEELRTLVGKFRLSTEGERRAAA
jgi:methyl-accepting chemotaxis protein